MNKRERLAVVVGYVMAVSAALSLLLGVLVLFVLQHALASTGDLGDVVTSLVLLAPLITLLPYVAGIALLSSIVYMYYAVNNKRRLVAAVVAVAEAGYLYWYYVELLA
jgi:hypothetical protein